MSMFGEAKAAILAGDLILVLHHHNNCTTLHMSVGPSVCDPPSCEGLLYWCCKSNIFLLAVGVASCFGSFPLILEGDSLVVIRVIKNPSLIAD
jgi:hypothetical protein